MLRLALALIASGSIVPALAAERLAPVDSARACLRHGLGFVEVPGTGTCIRIGGRVRSEAGTASRRVSRDDVAGLRNQGMVAVDTRTDTAYGPLRSYVRMRAGQNTGASNAIPYGR